MNDDIRQSMQSAIRNREVACVAVCLVLWRHTEGVLRTTAYAAEIINDVMQQAHAGVTVELLEHAIDTLVSRGIVDAEESSDDRTKPLQFTAHGLDAFETLSGLIDDDDRTEGLSLAAASALKLRV
jgi:hypothetical protein